MNIAVKRWVQIMGCGVRGEEMGECETWVRLVCETCLLLDALLLPLIPFPLFLQHLHELLKT